jgi:negative regulator of sigma E activity
MEEKLEEESLEQEKEMEEVEEQESPEQTPRRPQTKKPFPAWVVTVIVVGCLLLYAAVVLVVYVIIKRKNRIIAVELYDEHVVNGEVYEVQSARAPVYEEETHPFSEKKNE